MSIKKNEIMLYLEMLLLFRILRIGGIIKYLIFLAWVAFKAIKYNRKFYCSKWLIILPSLLCIVYGGVLAMIKDVSFTTIKEIGFVIAPVFAACVIYNCEGEKRASKYVDAIFYAIVTLFFIYGFRNYTEIDLMESTYAFILGIYTILYLYKKKYKMMTLSAVCTLLANKRIVLGAIAVSIFFLFVFFRKKYGQKNYYMRAFKIVKIIGIGSTALLLLFVYLSRSNLLGKFMDFYHINSNGRIDTWNYFSQYYTFGLMYSGLGLGKVQAMLNEWGNVYFGRLHCDVLMYYIELGFIGFTLYVYSQFVVISILLKKKIVDYKKAILLMTLLIYTLLCYCTDNIAIYIHYLFPYYMIFESLVFGQEPSLKESIN